MREILFRGKRLDNSEWVYGSFIQVEHEDGSFATAIFQKKDAGGDTEVSPATVGQYTGLNDKNGKRIFEGDIVDVKEDSGCYGFGGKLILPVEYQDGGFSPFAIPGWECTANPEECVVIGNIHDNPELLEGGDK